MKNKDSISVDIVGVTSSILVPPTIENPYILRFTATAIKFAARTFLHIITGTNHESATRLVQNPCKGETT